MIVWLAAAAVGGQPLSLKARALQWLAQREQSRAELRRKLLRRAAADAAASGDSADAGADEVSAAERVEAVLDWLEANNHLSQERFVESRIHARSARFGNLRIRQELKQHDLGVPPELAESLHQSEIERARAVRKRRFAELPHDAAERAKQARFLIGRGFTSETVRAALREVQDPIDC